MMKNITCKGDFFISPPCFQKHPVFRVIKTQHCVVKSEWAFSKVTILFSISYKVFKMCLVNMIETLNCLVEETNATCR